MSHTEQELLTLPEHPSSFRVLIRVRVARSLVFSVVFCASVFVVLWPIYCQSVFVLLFLITPFGIFKLFLYVLDGVKNTSSKYLLRSLPPSTRSSIKPVDKS